MIVRVISSTDKKYLGLVVDTNKPLVSPDGITFNPTKVQSLGDGYYRYSNSNYVIDVKDINHG